MKLVLALELVLEPVAVQVEPVLVQFEAVLVQEQTFLPVVGQVAHIPFVELVLDHTPFVVELHIVVLHMKAVCYLQNFVAVLQHKLFRMPYIFSSSSSDLQYCHDIYEQQ